MKCKIWNLAHTRRCCKELGHGGKHEFRNRRSEDVAVEAYTKGLQLLREVEQKLIAAQAVADAHPGDWGYTGDIQHIVEQLEQIVRKEES